jgi:polysaccharide pyruvyl transferase WcaK-like protein
MKLLYVGDNSDRLNLGCRATSIALRQLFAPHVDFVGTVPARMIASRWPVSDRIGDAAYGKMAKLLNTNRMRAVPVAGPLIGAAMDALGRRDAISHDLAANSRVLERATAYSADARRLMAWLEECDGALVNGEGDLIFGSPARQRLLFILTLCFILLQRGKKLFYMNAMASAAPGQVPNRETLAVADAVLAKADAFTLRDPLSLEFARAHLPNAAAKARVYPDAVFSWHEYTLDHRSSRYNPERLAPFYERTCHTMPDVLRQPYLLVGGSSRSAYEPARAVESYAVLVEDLKELGLPIALLPGCTGDFFLKQVADRTGAFYLPIDAPILAQAAILGNARAYISGRWHPSIMASLGGTPCVFMGSNSQKILALQHMLGYPDPSEHSPWPGAEERKSMVSEVGALLQGGGRLRSRIAGRARALGKDAARITHVLAGA